MLYISSAEDDVKTGQLTVAQSHFIQQLTIDHTGHLPNETLLAIGMKVMITENIATVANIANGSRGVITSIVLDPRESDLTPVNENGVNITRLSFPPSFVIIKLDFSELNRLSTLQENEIPLSTS